MGCISSSRKMADSAWMKEYLDQHNKYRNLHQVAPVKYNDKLNKLAQKWADHLAAGDKFAHSDCKFEGGRIGENIAMKFSSAQTDYPGSVFVDQWYSEVERYDFSKNGGPSTGHFTQVVWKASQEIGVGKAKTAKGKVLVVGQYLPAGNMMGENAQNVFPTRDGKIEIPKKDEPQPMQMRLGGGGCGGGHGGGGGLGGGRGEGLGGGPAGKGSGGDAVENYRSVKRSTQSKRLPDGRTETITKEVYTLQDGSQKTVEKKEVK